MNPSMICMVKENCNSSNLNQNLHQAHVDICFEPHFNYHNQPCDSPNDIELTSMPYTIKPDSDSGVDMKPFNNTNY